MAEFLIRPAEVEDYPRLVEIANFSMSEPLSLNEFSAREAKRPDGKSKRRFVAELAGDVVASGFFRRWDQFAEGMVLTGAFVDPAWQDQGIGRRMLQTVEQSARDHGWSWAVCYVRESEQRDVRFAKAAGYKFFQHLFESLITLEKFDPSEYVPLYDRLTNEGIRLISFAELGDTPESRAAVHHAYVTADRDTPGYEVWGVAGHEDFEGDFFGATWFRPEGAILAMDGNTIVGVTALGPTETGQWVTDFTGTLPEARGRGIAVALKSKALAYAKAQGAQTVRTNNDSNNAPMLAVNRKLGFEPLPGELYLKKDL